jgi:hypothetical protein
MPRMSTRFSMPFSLDAFLSVLPPVLLLSVPILFAVTLLHHYSSSSHTSSLPCDPNNPRLSYPNASFPSKTLLFYVLGCLTPSLFMPAIRRLAGQVCSGRAHSGLKGGSDVGHSSCESDRNRRMETGESTTRALLYGLDHKVLNAQIVLPETMWMNMGYWKVSFSYPFSLFFACCIINLNISCLFYFRSTNPHG